MDGVFELQLVAQRRQVVTPRVLVTPASSYIPL